MATSYEIKADFIKLLDPRVRVIEKMIIRRPFEFGSGPEKWETAGPPSEFKETQESNILWTRKDGLVVTRVKYFAETD